MSSIIIIGASSGIGRRVAAIYIERGWRVGVASRRLDALQQLHDLAPDRVVASMIDVNAPDAATRLERLIDTMGGVDIILNCAGVGFANVDLDTDKELRIAATNCDGFTRIVDAAFNYFARAQRPGHIAAITSIAGTRGLGAAPAYSASKRYEQSYLTAIRQLATIRRLPITTTDIRPGFARTELLDPSRHYPMLMEPEKVARQIVKAIDRRRRVKVIDCRWQWVVNFWRLIPNWLWVRLKINF